MINLLIIMAAIAVVIYGYAAIAYYFGFKTWVPFCGCKGASCTSRATTENPSRTASP